MTVKVSPKFQVVIPEKVRTALGIQAGSKVEVVAKGRVAYLVPVPELSSLQKDLKGKVNQSNIREKRDRTL
jgi:AbrB family looped-hinge helix DNA binding protein